MSLELSLVGTDRWQVGQIAAAAAPILKTLLPEFFRCCLLDPHFLKCTVSTKHGAFSSRHLTSRAKLFSLFQHSASVRSGLVRQGFGSVIEIIR